jgi:hypothetical protein
VVFFFQFCDVAILVIINKRIEPKFWLQARKSCYILVTCWKLEPIIKNTAISEFFSSKYFILSEQFCVLGTLDFNLSQSGKILSQKKKTLVIKAI